MKIGIVDQFFLSLQGALIEEGHDLKVYIDGAPQLDELELPATHHPIKEGQLTQVMDFFQFEDCDYLIVGLFPTCAGDYLKTLYPDKPMMYYSQDILLLEADRRLTHELLKRHVNLPWFRLPEIVDFSHRDDAQRYLETVDHAVVIKQNLSSKVESYRRTSIVQDPANYTIATLNSWFHTEGEGGCTMEQFIGGMGEVSLGMWFNGERFVGNPYYYIEHKGACNGDRGHVLTGEVGTTMSYFEPSDPDNTVMALFAQLQPMFEGKMNGMVDLNFKMVQDGNQIELWFMEFTLRFGRPTLEAQLAHIEASDRTVGEYYRDHIGPDITKENWFNLAQDEPMHFVGVTAYTYGLPLLSSLKYSAQPAFENFDWASVIPSNGQTWSASDFINEDKSEGHWFPIFTKYDAAREVYLATDEERHFICCGVSTDAAAAQSTAYSLLEGVSLMGITWRDDVGDNLTSVTQVLRQANFI